MTTIKKLIYAGLFISMLTSAFSCLNNDDDNASQLVFKSIAIDSVHMAESGTLGIPVEITTFATLQSNCQGFYNYDYNSVGNERTVIFWALEDQNATCEDSVVSSPSFRFRPETQGTYHFRFWSGIDEETSEDIFIEQEIVINNP